MATFYLLLLCIIPAVTSNAITQNLCSKGQEVWCYDLETAAACGKVSYCTQYVWQTSGQDIVEEKLHLLCKPCIKITKKLKEKVANTTTLEDIIHVVKTFCKLTNSEKCHEVVDKQLTAIAKALKGDMSPKEICMKIKLCKSEFTSFTDLSNSGMLLTSDCEMCRGLLQQIMLAISENMNIKAIYAVLHGVCQSKQSYFPECDSFLTVYKSRLLSMMNKAWDQETFCQEIEACVPAQPVPFLQENMCKEGPLYWCTNKETARKCNAVMYCAKQVWQYL
ncbi:prosaposin-like isoform X2 [Protopterus annectens]|uniref:prosaposin-like isoform X2 n=1 Tax=Protopterus annectens TaxID=7888 RepID=UPI001CFB3520|nr:prosaposin-like isoform X2 [Protopterus annectens]